MFRPIPNHFSLSFFQTGKTSLHCIRFTHPHSITELSIYRNAGDYLNQFTGLTILECNRIHTFNLTKLSPFISGQVAQLSQLRCNTHIFLSTYTFNEDDYETETDTDEDSEEGELGFLKSFYQSLQQAGQGNVFPQIRNGLAIYFNGVELKLTMAFELYSFGISLVYMHHRSIVNQLQVLPCRSVIETEYFDIAVDPDLFGPVADESRLSFERFTQLYPNLSIITFRQGPNRVSIPTSTIFSLFALCKGLRTLDFHYLDLTTDFYNELVQLDCCRSSLSLLSIFEGSENVQGEPNNQPIDFSFLTRIPLQQLVTNAVPLPQMLQLIQTMSIGQNFTFIFDYLLEEDESPNCFAFFRTARDSWRVDINHRTTPNIEWSYEAIFSFFTQVELYHTDHWITFPPNQSIGEVGWMIRRVRIRRQISFRPY